MGCYKLAVARPPVDLLADSIGPTVLRLALPTLGGLTAIILFGVVDTFWIAQLGDAPLAAMGYIFPVTAVVMNVTIGFGIGTTSAISRALGNREKQRIGPLTTHALILALASVMLVAGIGVTLLDSLFSAMGADAATLDLIKQYMRPWLIGVCFLVVPMIGNSAIRATGDTKSPGMIMAIAGLANALLTPLFVFGWGPVPRMELAGAAYASVASWTLTFTASMALLHYRERALSFRYLRSPADIWASWKQILHVGLPAAGANLLFPIADGILTAMLAAGHGNDAVAAFGVATRVEQVAMIGIFALSTSVSPLVGQNFGAGQWDRVEQTARYVMRVAMFWGAGIGAILLVLGWPLARLFSQTESIAEILHSYWLFVPLSYGLLGVAVLSNTTFNALRAPGRSTVLTLIRLFGLLLPLAVLGLFLDEVRGMFIGISIAFIVGGLTSRSWALRWIALQSKASTPPSPFLQKATATSAE